MEPPSGSTVHHVPDSSGSPPSTTKPYDATVSGTTLTATYVVEGIPTHRSMEWDAIQERWQRTLPSVWQRVYTPSNPPTVPPSGTYRVYDGGLLRETGTYTR